MNGMQDEEFGGASAPGKRKGNAKAKPKANPGGTRVPKIENIEAIATSKAVVLSVQVENNKAVMERALADAKKIFEKHGQEEVACLLDFVSMGTSVVLHFLLFSLGFPTTTLGITLGTCSR